MRDVIRVERLAEVAAGADDESRERVGVAEASTVDGASLAAVGRVADEVLPSIVARLAVSGLGEIEVRHAGWHIRVRRAATTADPAATGAAPGAEGVSHDPGTSSASSSPSGRSGDIATSPAVGYFAPRPDLAVGSRVAQGDGIGWIDVLGVRQEVVAPVDGLVGKLFVGPGDPVEYGQELLQFVASGATSGRSGQDTTEP